MFPLSRAFGSSSLGLPVIVAGANLLVSIGSRRHTQAFSTTLLAEEHAWLLVRRLRAPTRAPPSALCAQPTRFKNLVSVYA